MAVFPSSLPSPLRDGYSVRQADPFITTDFEIGASRSRRRTRTKKSTVNLVWLLTGSQLATLRAWIDSDIDGGAGWFTITLLIGGSYQAVEAKFKALPQEDLNGIHWRVSASLEVRGA